MFMMKKLQPLIRLFSRGSTHNMPTLPGGSNSYKKTFLHEDLQIDRAEIWQMEDKPDMPSQLQFGTTFADHMIEVDWNVNDGWTKPVIKTIKELQLHPGAKVFHYAVELFEGMKAFRGVDNRIRLFRPEMNMARMRRTAARSALPDFDGEQLLQIICDLVHLDREWVPYCNHSSLYIRPTMIATDPTLGVGLPRSAKLFVIIGPVGTFYQTGTDPVSLFANPTYVRAFPGGVGSFKMGCNYAPTISIGRLAAEYGCHQILWLFGKNHKLTEVGAMNIFVYWKNEQGEHELVTPPLNDGLILPGIIRDSVLTLAKEWGEFRVTERYPTMGELKMAIQKDRLFQIFGTGTAAAVTPVGRIVYIGQKDKIEELEIPTMTSGANVMQRFYETIVDIQYGRTDRPEWVRIIE